MFVKYLKYASFFFCMCSAFAKMESTTSYDDAGNKIVVEQYAENSKKVSKYNPKGKLLEHCWYGEGDKLAKSKGGFARELYEYDEEGRETLMAYFDTDNQACVGYYNIAKKVTIYHGPKYRDYEESYFAADGTAAVYEKLGYASKHSYLSEGLNEQVEIYKGVDSEPCLSREGCAKRVVLFSPENRVLSISYFGLDGKPCLIRRGYAVELYVYNDEGKQIATRYLGVDGKESGDKRGKELVHQEGGEIIEKVEHSATGRMVSRQNKRGQILSKAYYDAKGKPCPGKNGFSRQEFKYDEKDRKIEESFYDANGHLCLGFDSYAQERWIYDESDHLLEVSFYDADEKLCLSKRQGFARVRYEYDAHGRRISRSLYGADGCLRNGINCYAVERKAYDEAGREIEASYYGDDGQLRLSYAGWAIIRSRYDEKGNRVEVSYFGVDTKPCLNRLGDARSIYQHNEDGHVIRVLHYDLDDRLRREHIDYYAMSSYQTIHEDDYAMENICYDEQGRVIQRKFCDAQGEVCCNKDGFARIVYSYDEWDNVIETRAYRTYKAYEKGDYYFVLEEDFSNYLGQGVFDELTMPFFVHSRYYEAKDKLSEGCQGYAQAELRVDVDARKMELRFFDDEGKACLCKDGYAARILYFNEAGTCDKDVRYDALGEELK